VRKAGVDLEGADAALLVTDEEWQVALLLAAFPERVVRAGERNEPCVIAQYVLDLCRAFSSWYAQGSKDPALKVNCADPDLARARLGLARATQQTLRNGLHLLGLAAPEEM
jgi:arginyl-tRNA synthetase